jgi:CRP-like cAMP-binding protein
VDLRPDPAPRAETTDAGVRRAFERTLAPGEIVFDEGDPGDHLYVIQAGEVELSRGGPLGRRVARLGAGEFFGEMSVLVGRPRSERATARSSARVLALDAATLEALCLERPEVAIRMLRGLAGRLAELEARLAASGGHDCLRALVSVLVRRAETGSDGLRVPANLLGIAGQAGLSGLEAWRAVQQLLDRRLVRLRDDVLHIPDLEALAAGVD